MKSFAFWFQFHSPNRRQAIIWNTADHVPWRIYAALGVDELSVCADTEGMPRDIQINNKAINTGVWCKMIIKFNDNGNVFSVSLSSHFIQC